ncbi:MAG TPA: hypothetical protein VMP08_02115, partial [Anaerolineae bacterium]|nr:hypothetical protein [Anaerolineae bacterium]
MSVKVSQQPFRPGRTIRKYFVSGFVIFTFVAYALHERAINSDGGSNAEASTAPASASIPVRQARQAAPARSAAALPTVTPLPKVNSASPQSATPQPTHPPVQPTVQPAPT